MLPINTRVLIINEGNCYGVYGLIGLQQGVDNLLSLQGGQLTPIDLIVEERFHRAAPGGMGDTKAAGNYSPVRL